MSITYTVAIFFAGFICGILYMAIERHQSAKAHAHKKCAPPPIPDEHGRGTKIDIRA